MIIISSIDLVSEKHVVSNLLVLLNFFDGFTVFSGVIWSTNCMSTFYTKELIADPK